MGLTQNALRVVKEELKQLFVAYATGHEDGAKGMGFVKFDNFAAFIQQHHPSKFDYLTLDDFQRWLVEARQ